MHYKLFRVITLSARDITLKSDKDGKIVIKFGLVKKFNAYNLASVAIIAYL